MIDLIVFSVGSNRYALNIENIQRIIQADTLTNIPNAHPYIDGMMSHEEYIIKVMSFRKLTNNTSYEEELKSLFATLKQEHKEWFDALKASIHSGSAFTKTINPHMCDLGKWIDNFTSYDDKVSEVLSELVSDHKQLHVLGGEALEISKRDREKAKEIVDVTIADIYSATVSALDSFVLELDTVANSLQKLLIYDNNAKKFAIKVDTIEDIAHVQETDIMANDLEEHLSEFLELEGVLDLNGVLINVIKAVQLPN